MSKINPEELSEAEALELLTQYEKREVRWKNLGLKGTLIGAIGAALFAVMEVEALSFIFTLVERISGLSISRSEGMPRL